MSWSLVNKGLELIEGDLHLSSDKPNSKFLVGANQSAQKCIERKNKNALKAGLKKKKNVSSLNIKVKRALETYKAKKYEDNTLKNLKLLNKIDENLKTTVNEKKVKEYNLKKLREARVEDEKKTDTKKKNNSFFSEEDFEKMNNEWLALR
ncbi:hypothetical protein Anas_09297 [Armadillidium nasatum]|uniref:Active regulator of SIRT1 n=1 Tax=Armadillidium nasatum TaxID=96803 RepID=A0A5N5SJT3_9CRUS|nr:hypothetical protein Anas_09297 [Armadillidium nasatum]